MRSRWGVVQRGGAGEATGRDYIPSSRSSTRRGGGGAGLDTPVPAGPRSGSLRLLPGMFARRRTGQGPPKTPTAHTWSVWLAKLRDGGMGSVECEQGQRFTTPILGVRVPAASFLSPRDPRPQSHPLSARVTRFPRCLLHQTRFLGLQPPPPSDPQVLGLRPLLQSAHKWGLPAIPTPEAVGGDRLHL